MSVPSPGRPGAAGTPMKPLFAVPIVAVASIAAIVASAPHAAAQDPEPASPLARILDGPGPDDTAPRTDAAPADEAAVAAPGAATPVATGAAQAAQGADPVSASAMPDAEGTPPGTAPLRTTRVCLLMPLSGPHAALGIRIADLATRALSGAPGVAVARVDTQGTRAGAEAAVARAAEDACTLLLGGLGDREAPALADAAERAGIPAMVLGGEPDERVRNRVVWARAGRAARARLLAGHLADAGVTTAWVLASDTPYGEAEARAFAQAFPGFGGRVEAVLRVPPDAEGPATAAADLAARVRAARGDGCPAEAFVLVHDVATSRRLLGFLGFEGVVQPVRDRCPAPVVAGTALWLEGPDLSRTRALDGALLAAIPVRGPVGGLLEAEVLDAAALVAAAAPAATAAPEAAWLPALRALAPLPGRTGGLRIAGDRVVGKDLQVLVVRRGVPEPAGGTTEAGWTSSD